LVTGGAYLRTTRHLKPYSPYDRVHKNKQDRLSFLGNCKKG
jgi:hypothetical protein